MNGLKSQDVGLLLKLISLEKAENKIKAEINSSDCLFAWQDWDKDELDELVDAPELLKLPEFQRSVYSLRSLESSTGISKSQVSLGLKRSQSVGLLIYERSTQLPRVNKKALQELLYYGLKYFVPAQKGSLGRGIATAFAAPVLNKKLKSAGDTLPVWPDSKGNTQGVKIEPLFKSVPHAVKRDPELYALLALVDAIRLGLPRERKLAQELLVQRLEDI
ncbi:hypothetical protein [Marinospirillum sp.]|uniref:hypothetical protein n=1 Tax=Marinospirillum sp. TaxID=2183934 RepID=UPI002870A1A0|nr:hypothetical protein [Marinospirillum sp.]MDR9467733.1 hypothetical protein [Marinospirillum sp.]